MKGRKRHLLGAASLLCAALHAGIAAPLPSPKMPDLLPGEPEDLPYGVFPNLKTVQDAPRETEDLKTEIQDLSKRVSSTVKTFATRRNVTCLTAPCLIQAFPLLYNSRGSGFFGGFRANLQNIARTNPNLFSMDAMLVRSDTNQWLTFLALDLPKMEFLPLDPRWKIRGSYGRSTETRYFGVGPSSKVSEQRPDEEVRYALKELGFQTTLIVPITRIGEQRISLFGLFSAIHHEPSFINPLIPSKLFEDKPLGSERGGVSSRIGFGIQSDNRDRELLTRHGWSEEISGEISPHPLGDFRFFRISFIDRRYWSEGDYTLGVRTTMDSLFGDVPFWELSGTGGIDPIRDVSGTESLRAYRYGRFHERTKFIMSIDNRVHLKTTRLFGQLTEAVLIPMGLDIGRLGQQTAWSLTVGANFLFNRAFMVRTLTGWSPTGYALRLAFGQQY